MGYFCHFDLFHSFRSCYSPGLFYQNVHWWFMELHTQFRAEFRDPLSTPIARGLRVKSLRKMAGLSRLALETKYGISANTLQSWEKAKAGGLTQKGALRFIQALREEGVSCSADWLMFGIGEPAQLQDTRYYLVQETASRTSYTVDKQQGIITKELLTFRGLNQDTIDYQVVDDSMAPFFLPGDHVAGKKRVGADIDQLLHMVCIVQTQTNELLLRYLLSNKKPEFYNLSCINPSTSVYKYTLYDQKLISAAPVIWHRRRDF